MITHNTGVVFTCPECTTSGIANHAPDFTCTVCNRERVYWFQCPNCGTKIEVEEREIPILIRKYIKVNHVGIGHFHD